MYPNKDYTRVGGWLLVFIIWSGFQIVANVVTGLSVIAVLPVPALLAIIGHGGVRAAMLVLLLRRNQNCTKLLVAEAAVFVVELVITVVSGIQQQMDAAYLIGMLIGSVFSNVLFYAGWLAYFRRSVRVQAFFSGVNPTPYGGMGGVPPYGAYPPPSSPPDGVAHYCPRCGRPVTDNKSLFCASCGAPLYSEKGGPV